MHKKTTFIATTALVVIANLMVAQQEVRLADAKVIDHSGATNLPNFIKLQTGHEMRQENFIDWAVYAFNVPSNSTFKPYGVEKDELGYTHIRHRQYVNGYPVEASQVITHSRDGKITMVNGDYYQNFSSNTSASLSEQDALKSALKKVNAKKYMWENLEFQTTGGYDFTPKGELVFVHKKGGDYSSENMRFAYKFNIYAEVPLYRANVFVDANTGDILDEQNLICTADVVGTGVTKYSGTVPMTSDNASGPYRLRETGRGNGIQTYNLNNSTTYTNTDFTNGSSTWNLAGTNQAAADAHWGAEMTYDYYKNIHTRNSIDGNGYALLSYMHYSTNYANAFWNGQYMTYGDGDGTQFGIMTALDVCGHEITHGLTAFTAGLGGSGSGEPGALNEAWSDIMGTSIEAYSRPSQHDWKMGADISLQAGSQVRDLADEHLSGEGAGPNCYLESGYWDATSQEVHTNSGPAGHWYYLLCVGGSSTSGCGNAYNVAGITMAKAEKIAFRGLTLYFTSNTNYANARSYTIQAATDLYGNCSQELASTTNAWFAVNVGAAYSGGVPAGGFSAANTSSCSAPLTVNFTNTSSGATSYSWSFGDGGTSTTASPAHTYTIGGVYSVQLIATGTCSANSKDTVLQTNYVTVNGPPTATSPSVTNCGPQSYTLTANGVGTITWLDASGTPIATGSPYVTPTLTTTTSYSVTSSIMTAGTATVSGGPATATTLNAGGYLNYSHYLIFDATTGFTLKSVDIYAQASTGSQPTIQLTDNTGSVLQTINTNLTAAGVNTVALNWHIPVGTGYHLVATGANINLSRNNGGATYPMAISTVASVTGTDVTGQQPTYYYWFYNWKVAADVPCPSSPVTVTATIQNCTGINHVAQGGVEIYPNPAHDNLTISAPQNITSIRVIDMLGKTLIVNETANDNSVQIDLSALPAGVYFVKVKAGDVQKLVKVLKQ